jgi:hypothetical protein
VAKWNKSLLCLQCKDYTQGFSLYESRFLGEKMKVLLRQYDRPLLDTDQVSREKDLRLEEQGLGDCLQFARLTAVIPGGARRRGGARGASTPFILCSTLWTKGLEIVTSISTTRVRRLRLSRPGHVLGTCIEGDCRQPAKPRWIRKAERSPHTEIWRKAS